MSIRTVSELTSYLNADKNIAVEEPNISFKTISEINTPITLNHGKNDVTSDKNDQVMKYSLFEISEAVKEDNPTNQFYGRYSSKNLTYYQLFRDITYNLYAEDSELSGSKTFKNIDNFTTSTIKIDGPILSVNNSSSYFKCNSLVYLSAPQISILNNYGAVRLNNDGVLLSSKAISSVSIDRTVVSSKTILNNFTSAVVFRGSGRTDSFLSCTDLNSIRFESDNEIYLQGISTNISCSYYNITSGRENDLNNNSKVNISQTGITLSQNSGSNTNSSIKINNSGNGQIDLMSNKNINLSSENINLSVTNDLNVYRNGAKILSVDGNGSFHFLNDIYGIAMSARWADLAECYDSDCFYSPGTFVKFGGEKEITIATDEANAVVSMQPAFVMNCENDYTNSLPIALIGRVKVKIIGKIKKFDRIILSDIPGVGRSRGEDSNKKVLGVALENSDNDDIKLVLASVKLEL